MQDNARPHTARAVMEYLGQEAINGQRRASRRPNPPQTAQTLTE